MNVFESAILNNDSNIIISLGTYPDTNDIINEIPTYLLNNKKSIIAFCIDKSYNEIKYSTYINNFYRHYCIKLKITDRDPKGQWYCLQDTIKHLTIYHISYELSNTFCKDKWMSYCKKKKINTNVYYSGSLKTSCHYFDDKNQLQQYEKYSIFWKKMLDYLENNLKIGNNIYINNQLVFYHQSTEDEKVIYLSKEKIILKEKPTILFTNAFLEYIPQLASILYTLHKHYKDKLYYSYSEFTDSRILLDNYI